MSPFYILPWWCTVAVFLVLLLLQVLVQERFWGWDPRNIISIRSYIKIVIALWSAFNNLQKLLQSCPRAMCRFFLRPRRGQAREDEDFFLYRHRNKRVVFEQPVKFTHPQSQSPPYTRRGILQQEERSNCSRIVLWPRRRRRRSEVILCCLKRPNPVHFRLLLLLLLVVVCNCFPSQPQTSSRSDKEMEKKNQNWIIISRLICAIDKGKCTCPLLLLPLSTPLLHSCSCVSPCLSNPQEDRMFIYKNLQ